MQAEIPDFLLEMSKQMAEQPDRSISHPFWQVRCKRYAVTEEGYNDHHWILSDEDGEFYRSDSDDDVNEILAERYPKWAEKWAKDCGENFLDYFDAEFDSLPNDVSRVYMQEIEQVVSTHLTEHDALWFIKRTQHSYTKLYTYVESAYWSLQWLRRSLGYTRNQRNVEVKMNTSGELESVFSTHPHSCGTARLTTESIWIE
jgi:hypothetical protein